MFLKTTVPKDKSKLKDYWKGSFVKSFLMNFKVHHVHKHGQRKYVNTWPWKTYINVIDYQTFLKSNFGTELTGKISEAMETLFFIVLVGAGIYNFTVSFLSTNAGLQQIILFEKISSGETKYSSFQIHYFNWIF